MLRKMLSVVSIMLLVGICSVYAGSVLTPTTIPIMVRSRTVTTISCGSGVDISTVSANNSRIDGWIVNNSTSVLRAYDTLAHAITGTNYVTIAASGDSVGHDKFNFIGKDAVDTGAWYIMSFNVSGVENRNQSGTVLEYNLP